MLVVLVGTSLAGCLGQTPLSNASDGDEGLTPANTTTNGSQTIRSQPVNGSASTNGTTDAGNASADASTDEDAADPAPEPPVPLAFADPVQLNADGYGFEPSVDVGPDGTVYATAARGAPSIGPERSSSWLWYKANGSSWSLVPSPQQVHEKQPGFEGDIAIDAQGSLYFVDTTLADNTLSRWTAGDDGPTWEYSRPLQGSVGVDDRPWLAAHGDGIVYYAGNNGAPIPASNNAVDDTGNASRYWVYTSEDGGMTWSTGFGLANSGWCTIAANPADDQTVYAVCDQAVASDTADATLPPANRERVTVWKSTDRGSSWTMTPVAPMAQGLTDGYPGVAVDDAGTAYAAWPDGDYGDSATTRLSYAYEGEDGSWTVQDITPFEGSFDEVWVTAGSQGTLAVTFYGTPDTQPGEETEWFAYAMVTDAANQAGTSWQITKIDLDPVARGAGSPDDFFQSDLGPDDRLHVTYDREDGEDHSVLYAVQAQGENLEP